MIRATCSSKISMPNLLLRQNGKTFKFLKVEFRDRVDGSLYVIFDRAPNGSETLNWGGRNGTAIVAGPARKKRFRISYHESGTVVFHEHVAETIYDDQISELSGARDLAIISLPSIDRLDLEENVPSSDAVIDFPNDHSGRITFKIALTAPDFQIAESPIALISYTGWFAIAVYSFAKSTWYSYRSERPRHHRGSQ